MDKETKRWEVVVLSLLIGALIQLGVWRIQGASAKLSKGASIDYVDKEITSTKEYTDDQIRNHAINDQTWREGLAETLKAMAGQNKTTSERVEYLYRREMNKAKIDKE